MLTPSFHFNILQDFLHIMNEAADNLIDKLQREACDTGDVYDIFPDLTLSSLDIICGEIACTISFRFPQARGAYLEIPTTLLV